MTQLLITIEDKSILPHLKKILNAIEGVSISVPQKAKMNNLDIAIAEAEAGKTKRFNSVDDLFKDLGI